MRAHPILRAGSRLPRPYPGGFQGSPALSKPRIALLGLDGREVSLRRVGEGLYALSAALPKGLYYARIVATAVLKSLL